MRPLKKVVPKSSHCEECQAKYVVYRPWQKFCSRLCQFRAWAKRNPRVKLGAA